MNDCRKFRIEGRVQGVWFRESTRQQAIRLGITGCAANRSDGSVEVVAWGSPGALDALAEWLRSGPPLARVRSVRASPHAGERPDDFTTA